VVAATSVSQFWLTKQPCDSGALHAGQAALDADRGQER